MKKMLPIMACATAVLAAPLAEAADTTAVDACVARVTQDNGLTDAAARQLQPGTLLTAFGFPHALATGETVTGLCTRLAPLAAHAQQQEARVTRAEAGMAEAAARAAAAEDALRIAEGSWFRRYHVLGWLLALVSVFWMVFGWMLRFLREEAQRKRTARATRPVVHVGFLKQ